MISLPRLACTLLLTFLLSLQTGCAHVPAPAEPAPRVPQQVSSLVWEQDMQRFAAADAATPPPTGAMLFIGSSSIRRWETLAADFPGVAVVNRGFGGSEIRDSTWYAGRIVVPQAPRQVVLYAGDNDLASGRIPMQLRDDFRSFVQRLRRDLPGVEIAYISNKPSPARASLLAAQRQANALIKADARCLRVDYVDVFTPMLDAGGQPREDLFVGDRLHLNSAGYALWREVLAAYIAAPG